MKKILILTICLLPVGSYASLCGDSLVAKSKQTLLQVKKEKEQGSSSQFDFLMAEKNLLGLQLCQQPMSSEIFIAMAKNVNARFSLAMNAYNSGMVTEAEVTMIKNEKLMYKYNCSFLTANLQKKFDYGVITEEEMKKVIETCTSL